LLASRSVSSYRKITLHGLGQHWGNTSRARHRVETCRDRVEVILEQVRVPIQSHDSGRVTEHPLDRFHICSGANCKTGRCMPQLVRRQVVRRWRQRPG
jgi:hypothetical protein